MQGFILGVCFGITVILGIMDNKLDRIEKAITKPTVTQTACKLT